MKYPIVIHKDRDSDYGVTVPDLPGCFSAASTLEESMTMAAEAIALHLEGDGNARAAQLRVHARDGVRVFQPSGAWNIRGQLQHALAIDVFQVNHGLKL